MAAVPLCSAIGNEEMSFVIRSETAADQTAIGELTTAAFLNVAHANGTEAAIVRELRAAGALILSLVAVDPTGEIVGHAGFSPIETEMPGRWFGPVSRSCRTRARPESYWSVIRPTMAASALPRGLVSPVKACRTLTCRRWPSKNRRCGSRSSSTRRSSRPNQRQPKSVMTLIPVS